MRQRPQSAAHSSATRRSRQLLVVALADRVLEGDRDDVLHVLLVHLHDLQLRDEQLGERHGRAVDPEPVERDGVAHLELADEDVQLAAVRVVVDHETAVHADHVVEALVRLVARVDQQLERLAVALAPGHEVDVAIGPTQRRMHLALRVQCNGDAAEHAQLDAPGVCELDQPQCLRGHRGVGAAGVHRANVRAPGGRGATASRTGSAID